MSSKFEDHLWREFVREHGDDVAQLTRPTAGHHLPRPRLLVGGGVGLAGGATALALVLTAASAPPAFAVTRNHNGSVTVTIRSANGIAGANARLHQLGIKAQVAVTAPAGCQAISAAAQQAAPQQAAPQQAAAQSVALPPGTGNAIAQWSINPTAIAASQTVVLTPPPVGNSGTSSAGNSGTGTAGNSGNSGSSGQAWTCSSPAGAVARSGATGVTGNSGTTGPSGNSGATGNSGVGAQAS